MSDQNEADRPDGTASGQPSPGGETAGTPRQAPSGLPRRKAGGPGPAKRRRPGNGGGDDTPPEDPADRSALDAAAPFGRRFQSLGDRIGNAERAAAAESAAAAAQAEGDGGPASDLSVFDTDSWPKDVAPHAKDSPVTVALKPAETQRRPIRRRTVAAAAATAVLVLGGVLFGVLSGGQGHRPATSLDLDDTGGGTAVSAVDGTVPEGGRSGSASPGAKHAARHAGGAVASRSGSPSATPEGATGKPSAPAKEKPAHTAGASATPAAGGGPVDRGGVLVYSHASQLCLGVVGGAAAVSGAQLEITTCQNVAWQHWVLGGDGTIHAMGKCMNVGGGAVTDGAGVGWVTCNGTPGQKFALNAAHDIVYTAADKCLDVRDNKTDVGTPLQIWGCSGGDNQKWSTR